MKPQFRNGRMIMFLLLTLGREGNYDEIFVCDAAGVFGWMRFCHFACSSKNVRWSVAGWNNDGGDVGRYIQRGDGRQEADLQRHL